MERVTKKAVAHNLPKLAAEDATGKKIINNEANHSTADTFPHTPAEEAATHPCVENPPILTFPSQSQFLALILLDKLLKGWSL